MQEYDNKIVLNLITLDVIKFRTILLKKYIYLPRVGLEPTTFVTIRERLPRSTN